MAVISNLNSMKKIYLILIALLIASPLYAYILVPGGGTGTSTAPTYGQILVGNSAGTYNLIATSSLGITGGTGLSAYDAFTHPVAGQSATTSLMLLNGNASTTQLSTNIGFFNFFNATSTTATSTINGAFHLGTSAVRDNLFQMDCLRNYPASQSVGGCGNINNTLNSGPGLNIFSSFGVGATAPQFKVRNDNSAYDQEMVTLQSLSLTRSTLGVEGSSTAQAVSKFTHYGNGADGNVALFSGDLQGTGTAAQGFFLTSTQGGTTGKLMQLRNNLLAFGGADAQVNLFDITGNGKVGISSSTPGSDLAIGTTGGINITSTATSTFGSSANGINITNGCYAIAGTCLTGGTSTGLSAYDAFTHPYTGTSATTSVIIAPGVISTASSTITGNTDGTNLLFVNATATSSPSISTGGLIHCDMKSFDGTCLGIVASSSASNNGRLMFIINNSYLNPQNLFLASSTAANSSVMNLKGWPTGQGILKIEHTGSGTGFSSGSAISVDNSQNDSQGLFIKTGTGIPFQVQSAASAQLLKFDTTGFLGIATTTPGTMLSLGSSGGINFTPTATSTFGSSANGINITNGCFAINGSCLSGAVSSVSNSNSSLTISPTTGAVVASLNVANPNTWTGTQTFNISPVIGVNTQGILLGSKNWQYASSSNGVTIFGLNAGGQSASTTATGNIFTTAYGYNALSANTTGTRDVALGAGTLQANTTGVRNTAVGDSSLLLSITGSDNTGIGNQALTNSSESFNTAVGSKALGNMTSGSYNTAIGHSAGQVGTAGPYASSTFIGALTNFAPSVAIYDTTELGMKAGYNNTGWNSTFLGELSGYNNTTGNNNIAIGYNALMPSATASNQLNIGNIIFGSGLTATSTSYTTIPSLTGSIGISTTTPYATLSIQTNASSGDALAIATSSGAAIFGVDNDGHTWTSGPAPAISSCGTGTGTVVGDDQSGAITTATAATACTMTFSKAYRKTPTCTVTDNSLVGFADVSTISNTAVTFGISSALTGGLLYYSCQYHT